MSGNVALAGQCSFMYRLVLALGWHRHCALRIAGFWPRLLSNIPACLHVSVSLVGHSVPFCRLKLRPCRRWTWQRSFGTCCWVCLTPTRGTRSWKHSFKTHGRGLWVARLTKYRSAGRQFGFSFSLHFYFQDFGWFWNLFRLWAGCSQGCGHRAQGYQASFWVWEANSCIYLKP